MFRVGKEKPFDSVMKVFRFTNIYPERNDKVYLRRFFIKYITVRVLSFILFCLGGFLHMMKVLRENIEGIDISEDLVVFLGGIGTLQICALFTCNHRKWSNFLHDLIDFSCFGKPQNIANIIKRLNLYAKLFIVYYCCGCLFYGIAAYLEAPHCHKINVENNLNLLCDTFVPIWLPFDIPQKNFRQTIFVIQYVLLNMVVVPAGMVCFICWESTELICAHISHLKQYFQRVIEEENACRRSNILENWIRYHNHILRLAYRLNRLVKITVGQLSIISALICGCTENQIIRSKTMGASLFLLGWLLGLFVICHAGERLTSESLSIQDAILGSRWYSTDIKLMKSMIFIIKRCQKPIYLEAFPLGSLNYALFVMVIRTSYSYLTLLNHTS